MASSDEPQKIKIGGAGYKKKLLIITLFVSAIIFFFTFFYPSNIPPGNYTVVHLFDPASGQPLQLDFVIIMVASLINVVVYGVSTLIIGIIYILKRRSRINQTSIKTKVPKNLEFKSDIYLF